MGAADLILHRGKITTNDSPSEVEAVAIAGGRVAAVGPDGDVLKLRGPAMTVVELAGRRAVAGLNDSHLHRIRGGLNFNLELRWDGGPSLADALRKLTAQAPPLEPLRLRIGPRRAARPSRPPGPLTGQRRALGDRLHVLDVLSERGSGCGCSGFWESWGVSADDNP